MTNLFAQFSRRPLALCESHAHALSQSVAGLARMEVVVEDMPERDLYGNAIKRYAVEDDGTAVVPLRGIVSRGLGPLGEVFGFTDIGQFTASVSRAMSDPDVKRIALDIASPGGTVVGTRDAAEMVARAAEVKPMMAYTDDMMASAAYYVAAGATMIYAGAGSVVGSVGVYTFLVDATEAYEREGVSVLMIRSGEQKAIGACWLDKLDEDKVAAVQAKTDALGAEFRAWVKSFRDVSDDDLQGQTYMGTEAVFRNFADRKANTFSEALRDFADRT